MMTEDELRELKQLLKLTMINHAKEKHASMCMGKFAFETRTDALKGARHKGMNTYRCDLCSRWHVSSGVTSRQKRIAEQRMRAR